MKFAKILFCAMAVVASACFVSCTTSETEKSAIENVVSNGAVEGTKQVTADESGKAVATVGTVTAKAEGLAKGEAIAVSVAPAGGNLSVAVSTPKEATISIDKCTPNAEYKVVGPNGTVSTVKADSKGTITFPASNGTFVVMPVGHNGGAAN